MALPNPVFDLYKIAKNNGLKIIDRGNDHYQITGGGLLVNYYPTSRRMTAYIAATNKGYHNVSPSLAVQMALSAPAVQGERVRRKKPSFYAYHRRRLLRKNPRCKWCDKQLNEDTATLEHVIPLKRGGLDLPVNFAIACAECNQKRGHNMPELKKCQ